MSGVFQAIINTLSAGLGWLWAQAVAGLTVTWRAALGVLDQVLAWGLAVVEWFVVGTVGLVLGTLELLIGALPDMPEEPGALGALGDALGIADRYLPVTEVLLLAVTWGVIYGGMYAYKGYKAIRGGG